MRSMFHPDYVDTGPDGMENRPEDHAPGRQHRRRIGTELLILSRRCRQTESSCRLSNSHRDSFWV